MPDVYELETYDYELVKGDTFNLPLRFWDKDGQQINIESWQATFKVKDHINNEIVSELTKTHDDSQTNGDGIYFYSDTEKPDNLEMTASDQLVVVLGYLDTAAMEPGIYKWEIEFWADGLSKYTPVKGHFIVTEEIHTN